MKDSVRAWVMTWTVRKRSERTTVRAWVMTWTVRNWVMTVRRR